MAAQKSYSASFYIGYTTSGSPRPVFFGTHTPVHNNKPPGIVITGAPGSGKTNFLLTLAAHCTLAGMTGIAIDPKGDFASLKNISNDLGQFNLWNLASPNRVGFLDPFRLSESKSVRLNYALTVIDLFTGGLTDDERTRLFPILKDVNDTVAPSLTRVVEQLRGSIDKNARNLGTKLEGIRDLPYSQVAFAPNSIAKKKATIGKGLTVILASGLNFPKTPEEAKMTQTGRLASGILYLITQLIYDLLNKSDSRSPKVVFIDEAWAIAASEQGAQVIKSMALLGRSKNLAMVLATQNSSHLESIDIESTVTTWFAFNNTEKEGETMVRQMRLPKDHGFEGIFSSLPTGCCIMKDWYGQVAPVQIDNWNKEWSDAFDSNPLAQQKRKAADD